MFKCIMCDCLRSRSSLSSSLRSKGYGSLGRKDKLKWVIGD